MRRTLRLVIFLLMLVGCGGKAVDLITLPDPAAENVASLPTSLPVDHVQPWELVDGNGAVIPSRDYFRTCSVVNLDSEFVPGVEHVAEGGTVIENGEAAHIESGEAGSKELSFVMYRLEMGGSQPGVISADANLLPRGDDNLSDYWLGLSNYGKGIWDWYGPFQDSHVRVSTGKAIHNGADFLSAAGNLFVCVVAFDGAGADVVGVAANAFDATDIEPPSTPTGLTTTPVKGGLELVWNDVIAGDLAGYRIYYANHWFLNGESTGVSSLESLEGRRSCLLTGLTSATYIRVAAVDISGNESEPSGIVSDTPLVGEPSTLVLLASSPGGKLQENIILTATGASFYDWDLDGDGTFDITGNPGGSASADTTQTGIIRPIVRGTSSDGSMVACGGVSVIVTSNSRPVASAIAAPQNGDAPLTVTFVGTAEDLEDSVDDLSFAWDFAGDGAYDVGTDMLTPPPHEYVTPGVYNVKFRVTDSEGAWDVDTVTVVANRPPTPTNRSPVALLTIGVGEESGDTPHVVIFNASGSDDPDAGDRIVKYWWDFEGDGGYDKLTTKATYSHTYNEPGIFNAQVMVEDSHGATDTDAVEINVNVPGNTAPTADVTATPDNGEAPLEVDFDAQGSTDPDGSIVRYDWDFDGDDNYELYDGDNSPDWVYTAAGSYTAQVRVTDDVGAQDIDSVTVTVNALPIADLRTDDAWGYAPHYVNFNASTSTDPDGSIAKYEWDWTSDSVYDLDSGTTPTASYTYSDPGIYTATLRVTDDDDATDTALVTVYAKSYMHRTPDSTGETGEYTSLAIVNGNPAISYLKADTSDLMYVRSTNHFGGDWGTPVAVDSTDDVGWATSLAVVSGHPAICYRDVTHGYLKYVRASDTNGATWASPVTVDSSGDVDWYTSMTIVNGNPAISYHTETSVSVGSLKYVRATNSNGSSWGTPETPTSTGQVGRFSSLVVANGRPAISYDSWDPYYLMYVRASDVNGDTWGTPITVDDGGAQNVGWYNSLAIVNGRPAICYYDITGQYLKYVRANNANGSSWSGNAAVVVDNPTAYVGLYTSLAVVNGFPAISYHDNSNDTLKYAVANDCDGLTWGTPQVVDYSSACGIYTSLCIVDGFAGISYHEWDNHDLEFTLIIEESQ